MGYKFQFVTLAGFHSLNHGMFELSQAYSKRGMAAYSELQQARPLPAFIVSLCTAIAPRRAHGRHSREVPSASSAGHLSCVKMTWPWPSAIV